MQSRHTSVCLSLSLLFASALLITIYRSLSLHTYLNWGNCHCTATAFGFGLQYGRCGSCHTPVFTRRPRIPGRRSSSVERATAQCHLRTICPHSGHFWRHFFSSDNGVNYTNYCVVVLKCLALSTTLILANWTELAFCIAFRFYFGRPQCQWCSPRDQSWSRGASRTKNKDPESWSWGKSLGYTYYAALLPRRGPHIALHSVCPSVCLSVCPSRYRASRGAT